MPADVNVQPVRPGLTDQQRRAVTARGASVALSAGAGCGKTFVLTERFLAELEPGGAGGRPRLNQIAAITFTERAAREMRNRIRAACRRRLQECPENQVDYWLALIRELDTARISTIHSFCGSLLRSHAVEAGIDPRFRVLDGAQAGTLLFELTDDVLRQRLADRDEAALALVTRFGLDRLRGMIDRLLAARQEINWDTWRGETAEGLVARWLAYWRRDTLPRLLRQISESADAKTLLDLSMRFPPNHPVMRHRCDRLLELLPACSSATVVGQVANLPQTEEKHGRLATCPTQKRQDETIPAEAGTTNVAELLQDIRDTAKVQGGGTKKNWATEEIYERFRDAAKGLRDAIDGVKGRLAFDAEAARPAAEAALRLVALAGEVAGQYDHRKSELGVLDFNDLLIQARELLVGPERAELRRRLAAQIRLLLVDEFQDTDPLQVELVKSLCDNEHLRGKLFFVGDHKQSIYRFRGADPSVFRRLREEIPAEGRLPLSLNFRSQPAILDFVNSLFCEELGPDYESLRASRPQVSPTPAVEFLWATDGREGEGERGRGGEEETADDIGPRERLRRREADWIARRIRGLLDSGEKIVWDEDAAKNGQPAARPARLGDFALLFRAMTNVEYYEEALQRHGIDYYLVGGRAFYAQQEIFDLLNLLRAIDIPGDEVSLAGVLRSPMFGLYDETLFWLSRHRDGLAAGLMAADFPLELDGPQRQLAGQAAKTLRELRGVKDRLPIARLIQEAMRLTGYDAVLPAEFLGERKLANLHKLVEQARSFDKAGIFSLSDFITQLSEFVVRQPDEALAATHPESTNVVKLMSIHQSKGLEFPVVIVPDIGRPRRAAGPSVAFTPELGPLLKDDKATTGYDLFMAAERDEEMAELSRLLYVATTRAADYLILSAGVEQPGDAAGGWMELLASRFDLTTGDCKAASDSSLVKVTTVEPPVHTKPTDLRRRRDLAKMVEKAQQMADDGQGRQPRFLAPVPADAAARRQYSFSRLTGMLHARTATVSENATNGDASTEAPLDARGLGTLVHAVLEEIDFSQPGDIADRVRRLAEQHLSGEDLQRLDEPIEIVERFAGSPRAAALATAKEVYHELEFMLAWPPDDPKPDGRFLQGFIDCLYRGADGGWRLIDFKTNRATAETLAEKAAAYEMQMLVYGLAAETILKTPPVELALCFLRPGLEYHFPWDAAARRRAIELVNQALP